MNTPKNIDLNNETKREITMVTAFLDIGRSNWNKCVKSTKDFYIESFKNYLLLDYKMVIFLDDTLLCEFIEDSKLNPLKYNNKIFIPINIEWLKKNLLSWKQYDVVKNIMQSKEYINLLKDRIEQEYPENIFPEYNIVNHSKIDFIHFVINNNLIPKNDFICWTDFGYHYSVYGKNFYKFPNNTIDIRKLNQEKINFCLHNKILQEDFNPYFTLVNAKVTFTGGFFGANQENMLKLYELYHECLNDFYSNNLSDDDQHIYLRCFIKNPNMFELYLSEYFWPESLTYFQK